MCNQEAAMVKHLPNHEQYQVILVGGGERLRAPSTERSSGSLLWDLIYTVCMKYYAKLLNSTCRKSDRVDLTFYDIIDELVGLICPRN